MNKLFIFTMFLPLLALTAEPPFPANRTVGTGGTGGGDCDSRGSKAASSTQGSASAKGTGDIKCANLLTQGGAAGVPLRGKNTNPNSDELVYRKSNQGPSKEMPVKSRK